MKQILKPKDRSMHKCARSICLFHNIKWNVNFAREKVQEPLKRTPKLILPTSFIKADAKSHPNDVDGRIPLQSTVNQNFFFFYC